MKFRNQFLILTIGLVFSPVVLAHENHHSAGFVSGLLHPLTGLDHLFALVLAGLLVGRFAGNKGMVLVSLLFAILSGVSAGILFGAQAWVNMAILVSVPVIMAFHFLKQKRIINYALSTTGLFMFVHGWAHGIELLATGSAFIPGMLVSSALILLSFSGLGAAMLTPATTVKSHA